MKCCINNFDTLIFTANTDNVGEISFKYHDRTMEEVLEILNDNKDRRVILDVYKDCMKVTDMEDFKMIYEVYKNIVFRIHEALMGEFKEAGLPFFINHAEMCAETFDELISYCSLGITDVYITGELGFSLDRVKKIADKNEVKIRAFPNITQYSGTVYSNKEVLDPLTSFWIRPGDLYLYEDYIDTIEFMCDKELQQTYYEMYFTNIGYIGNLSIAIEGMVDLGNTLLPKEFTEFRLNCRKRCRFDECHKCHKFEALAKLIGENGLEVEKVES